MITSSIDDDDDFGGDYIDPVTGNNELPYDFADSNIIRWQSGTYLHAMEISILKHTAHLHHIAKAPR